MRKNPGKEDMLLGVLLTLIGAFVGGYIFFDINAERIGKMLGKRIGEKASDRIKSLIRGEPMPPPTTPFQRMTSTAAKEAVKEIRNRLTWEELFS